VHEYCASRPQIDKRVSRVNRLGHKAARTSFWWVKHVVTDDGSKSDFGYKINDKGKRDIYVDRTLQTARIAKVSSQASPHSIKLIVF